MRGSRIVATTAGLLLLGVFPFMVHDYVLYVAMTVAIFGLVALGLNVLFGYAGQISLGHAGFLCIGAYATATFSALGVPIPLGLAGAGVITAIGGLLMGFPAIRLSGLHLAIATLGFGVVVERVFLSWESFTGGGAGLKVARPSVGPWLVNTNVRLYYLVMGTVVLLTLVARSLLHQKIGRAFQAIRESEIAASALGIDIVRTKLLAFVMSAFYTGVAGGLFAHLIQFLSVQTFNLSLSISFLIMVIIGGLGSLAGSFIGAAFVMVLPELLRPIKNYQALVFGTMALATILFVPGGIFEGLRRVRAPKLTKAVRSRLDRRAPSD